MHKNYFPQHFAVTGSTNEEAKKMAAKLAPAWSVVSADSQTAGRGRFGKDWISPSGNLYASVLLWPEFPPEIIAQLSFVTAVAIGRTLTAVIPAKAGIHNHNLWNMDSRLRWNDKFITYKWPNDILMNSKKVAGILLESGLVNGKRWLVIGFGVNIKNYPENTDYPATSIGSQISAKQLLEKIMDNLIPEVNDWEKNGFEKARQDWLKCAVNIGQPVNIKLGNDILSGIFEDLDGAGNLLLRQETGIKKISSGELFFMEIEKCS